MSGTVTIEWCPSCKAWGKSRRLSRDLLTGLGECKQLGSFEFKYRADDHECASCGVSFVKTRLTTCNPEFHWQAAGELSAARKTASLVKQGEAENPEKFLWNSHPELADFSALVTDTSGR